MRCQRCYGSMIVDRPTEESGVVEPWRCETWRCLRCGDCIAFAAVRTRAKRPRPVPGESRRPSTPVVGSLDGAVAAGVAP